MNDYRLKIYSGSIYICGFMGTGKTTLGKKLAKELNREFMDLDEEIISRAGKSIQEIFTSEGEEGFRKLEWEVLKDVTKNFSGIVALGGGTLQNQRIVDHIKLFGLLIFLDTPFATLFERITRNKKRPLLLDDNGELKADGVLQKELSTLLEKRKPLYEQAQIRISRADFDDLDSLTADLIKRIKRYV